MLLLLTMCMEEGCYGVLRGVRVGWRVDLTDLGEQPRQPALPGSALSGGRVTVGEQRRGLE